VNTTKFLANSWALLKRYKISFKIPVGKTISTCVQRGESNTGELKEKTNEKYTNWGLVAQERSGKGQVLTAATAPLLG
jgi:hypothetical protein